MAHVCTVCHPGGLTRESRKHGKHRGSDDGLDGSCCVGCACGWWRNLPDDQLAPAARAKAEKLASGHDRRPR